MLAVECGYQELDLSNQQFVWIKSYTTDPDSAVVVRGTLEATVLRDEDNLFFVKSACEGYIAWPETFGCVDSRITLALLPDVTYDIIGWSEPVDRRSPDMTMTVFHEAWICCE